MVGSSLSFLMESLSGQSVYGVILESLYGVTRYLAAKTVDEATKKLFVQPLLKKLLPESEEAGSAASVAAMADFSDRLIEYLERNNRGLETTLHCLEQLADRIDKLDASVSRPVFVALGLPAHADRPAPQNDAHVQRILNDHTPGLPQSIKSGYALLHLRRGNKHLAEIYARSTLKINPVEPKAWYVLGMLKLQSGIIGISPPDATEAERYLATAAEAGLSAQCAMPRAALRVDHYLRKGRAEPDPSLRKLAALYGTCRQEAVSWPYGPLNNQIPTSLEFKKLWKGK